MFARQAVYRLSHLPCPNSVIRFWGVKCLFLLSHLSDPSPNYIIHFVGMGGCVLKYHSINMEVGG